jgi:hypothetical protein
MLKSAYGGAFSGERGNSLRQMGAAGPFMLGLPCWIAHKKKQRGSHRAVSHSAKKPV